MSITCIFAAWKTVKMKWELALEQAHLQVLEEEPKLKQFEPKNVNLPILDEYSEDLGEEYWTRWVKSQRQPDHGLSQIDLEKRQKDWE